MFTDEFFLPSAVIDLSLQDNKIFEICGLSDSHTSHLNLDVSIHPSRPGLNTDRLPSESHLCHGSPV
jgi:hypothetical protein